jgi:hypothetical protein
LHEIPFRKDAKVLMSFSYQLREPPNARGRPKFDLMNMDLVLNHISIYCTHELSFQLVRTFETKTDRGTPDVTPLRGPNLLMTKRVGN